MLLTTPYPSLVMKTRPTRISLTALALAALGISTAPLCAQNGTWSTVGGGSWATAGNWTGGIIATGVSATADFSQVGLSAASTVTLDGAKTIGNLIFGDVNNTYGWTLSTGTGGPLTLAGTPTVTLNGTTTNTISAVMTGTAGLILNAPSGGSLTISALNTYSGTTVVNSGQLILNNGGSAGCLGGSTLTVYSPGSVLGLAGNALGYGSYWTRTVNLYGSTFTTAVNSDQGWGVTYNMGGATLRTNGLAGGHFSFGSGTVVNVFSTNGPSTIAGAVTLRDGSAASFTANVNLGSSSSATSPDLLVSSVLISSATGAGITKNGAGFMALTAASGYAGPTLVKAGTLVLGAANGGAGTIGSSPIVVFPGAELDLNQGDVLGYSSTAALTNMGTIKKIYSQAETIYRLIVLSNAVMNSTIASTAEAFETFGSYILALPNTTNSIDGTGRFGLRTATCYWNLMTNSQVTISTVVDEWNGGTAPLNICGPGVMVLSGANTYTGSTLVTNGATLVVSGAIANGAVYLTNASLKVTGTVGTGGIIASNSTISGSGTINSPVTLNAGAVLTGTVSTKGLVTVNSGATLSGSGAISAAVTVNAGGTLAPGTSTSFGAMPISGVLTLGGTCTLRLSKTGGVLANDSVQGMSSVAFGGALAVTNATADATTLAIGDTFTLFNAATYGGSFASISLPTAPNGAKWDTSGLAVSGTIKLIVASVLTTPAFNPPAGGYIGAQHVSISSDAGSTIYYTTDGSTPTLASPSGLTPVTVTVPVNATTTLNAFAHESGFVDSPVATAIYNTLDHGAWTNLAGGSWVSAGNWSNGVVALGSGTLADFSTLTLPANATVTLDGTPTIGTLHFGDLGNTYVWTLANGSGGPLTLDAGASQPAIIVDDVTNVISTALAGTNGFVESGAGTLSLANAGNSYSGNLNVNGTLITGAQAASASAGCALGAKIPGRSLIIGPSGSVLFTINNVFGGGGMYATNLPTVVVNGGVLNSTRYNALPNLVLNGGTLSQSTTDTGATYAGWQLMGSVTVTGSTPSTITSAGSGRPDHILSTAAGTVFYVADVTGDVNPDLIVAAILQNSSGDYTPSTAGNLVKAGPGTMLLTAANTYNGTTTVSNGTLQVDGTGSIALGQVNVLTNAVLDGTGGIFAAVSVQPGGTLTTSPTNIATLMLYSNVTLAGNVNLRLSKNSSSPTGDQIAGMLSVTFGGTLNVTNITSDGTLLADGDRFYLFSANAYAGVFTNFNLPALPAGLSWDKSSLTVNGSIAVANAAATPFFSPVQGAYLGSISVSIIGDPGSTIYYTMDGNPPTTSSPHGLSPITGIFVPANTTNLTFNAYASRPGYSDSPTATATYNTIAYAVWTAPWGGSWPEQGNWLFSILGTGSSVTADFSTLSLPQDATVTLDGAQTIGNLIFGDVGNSYNWIITNGTAGPLTFDGTNTPTVTVNNDIATFTSAINGTNGLVKNGPGVLVLNAVNTLTNTVSVNGGTLVVNAGNGNPSTLSGVSIVVNSGGTIQMGTNNNAFVGSNPAANTNRITINTGGLVMNTNGTTCHLLNVVLDGGTLAATTPYVTWGNWNFDLGVTTLGDGKTSHISGGDAALLQVGGSVFNILATDTVIVSTVLEHCTSAADNGLVKTGPGLLVLTATNTYTSATTLTNGTLEVDGSTATSAITVSNATLNGSGLIGGAVTVQSNGVLAGSLTVPGTVTLLPGATISGSPTFGSATTVPAGALLAPGATGVGAITVTNLLTLAGAVDLRVVKTGAVLTNDKVQVLTTVTYGGSLTVIASGNALANGDSFTLFPAAKYAGAFASITLPTLPTGLHWDMSGLMTSGTIKVSNAVSTPIFTPPAGGYGGSLSVTISSDAGSTIFYTTDGSTPTTASASGASPLSGIVVPVGTTMTISALATNVGYGNSLVASATYTTLATPTWTNLAGGSWSITTNWLSGAIANGSGIPADFSTLTLPTNTTVTLDSTPTIGALWIGDVGNAFTWTINNGATGPLTLDAGATVPVLSSVSTNIIGALLAGTNGAIKTGAGVLTLNNMSNSFTGTLTVNQGILAAGGAQNPTTSTNSDLGLKAPGRLIVVNTNATMAWVINNVFGGAGMTNAGLPTIQVDGGTFTANRYNAIGNVTLNNGGTLLDAIPTNTDSTNYDGFQFLGTVAVRGALPSFISTATPGRGDHLLSGAAITFDVADVTGDANADLTVGCPLRDGSNDYNTNGLPSALNKTGAGTMVLAATNTFTGVSTVNGGTLEVNGSLGTNAVTVNAGDLAGLGLIAGPVTVNAGATLAPGSRAAATRGTLTISNSLTLAGTATFRLNKTGTVLSSDLVAGLSQVTYGGTLTATLSGDALAEGDTFTIVNAAATAGAFAITNLPALPGLGWTWNPTAGTLSVIAASVNTQPPHITYGITAGNLNLTWPTDHTGWRLLVQTNALNVGLSTNWFTWPNSATTNSVSIPMNRANPTVFYRLVYP